MKRLISAFSLVAMLLVFTGCGDNLTNSVYTAFDGGLGVIKFFDNNKFVMTVIDNSHIKDKEPLYICYGNGGDEFEYRKEGKSIKVIVGGIIKDEMIFEDGVIKWGSMKFELDKRFSSIKRSGKYGGTMYTADNGSEIITLVFINDSKVFEITKRTKILQDYEVEDGKVYIGNYILEEAKDKLIYRDLETLIFKKSEVEFDDIKFQEMFGDRRMR